MTRSDSLPVPDTMRPRYDAIVALLDPFCAQHLNEDYAYLCRELAAALATVHPLAAAAWETGDLGLRHRVRAGHRQLFV